MRQSDALLDAVQRLQGHRSVEALADALCETARDVTSAPVAGVVRWNATDGHGVVQAMSPGGGDRAGLSRDRAIRSSATCAARGLPLVLEDAVARDGRAVSVRRHQRRAIGSLAIVPILGSDGRDRRARRRGQARRSEIGQSRGAQCRPARGGRARAAGDRLGDRGGQPSRAHRRAHRVSPTAGISTSSFARGRRDGPVRRNVLADPGRSRPLQGGERPVAATRPATPCSGTSRRCSATRFGRWICARDMAGKRSRFCCRRRRSAERSSSLNDCGRRWRRRPTRVQRAADPRDGVVRGGDVSGAGPERRLAAGGGGQGAVRGEGARVETA